MLSRSDADIVKRDTAIPGLATLLDPDAFVHRLRASMPEAELGEARSIYVRYKPRKDFLVAYQLEVAGVMQAIYAKAFSPREWRALAESGVLRPLGLERIVLEDCAVVVSPFPNDSKLRSLTCMADAQSQASLLRELMPDQSDLWRGEAQKLQYKPERRYVARWLSGNEPRAVLKMYTADGYHIAQRNAAAFVARGPLRFARRLGRSERHCTLALEWLPGLSLREAIASLNGDKLDVLATVGAALAALHAQNPDRLMCLSRETEVLTLLSLAEGISFICPRLGKRASGSASRLASRLINEPAVNLPIHGDFYAEQVLLAGDRVIILDLDEVVRGDIAADLGNFVAHLELDALRGSSFLPRIAPMSDALFEGYQAAARHPIQARAQLYIAAGLFRLSHHPFRRREPNWPEQTEAIIDRVEELLDKTEPGPANTTPSCTINKRPDTRAIDARCEANVEISCIDPSEVACDSEMPYLRQALDQTEVQRQFGRGLPRLAGAGGFVQLRAIRVTRYKPGRRCVIEYDVDVEKPHAPLESLTLIGKARAGHSVKSAYLLLDSLWNAGFGLASSDEVSVPEPLGVVPDFQIWLQRKVLGKVSTELLAGPRGVALAQRIAAAAYKLHRTGVTSTRQHTMADELRILRQRLPTVKHVVSLSAGRIERLLDACEHLATTIPEPLPLGIHRDFYPDHVIVDGERLYLIDFDLYCEGDSALDIGNFLGHITEQSLRTYGNPTALIDVENAMIERFVELSGESIRSSVRGYATLTLVRHVYLSTLFPERRPFTGDLLELCEDHLGVRRW